MILSRDLLRKLKETFWSKISREIVLHQQDVISQDLARTQDLNHLKSKDIAFMKEATKISTERKRLLLINP